MEGGNMGHRPKDKGGYFPVPPVDSATDIRAEMVSTMSEMGLEMEKHHHEVAPSQHELGMKFGPLIKVLMISKNINIVFIWLRSTARQPRSCLNLYTMIMAQVCMFTNRFGKETNQSLLGMDTMDYPTNVFTTLVE